MLFLSKKKGEKNIYHKKEHSSSIKPFLVTITYFPYSKVSYFIMAKNKDDAYWKVNANLKEAIEHCNEEGNTCLAEKIESILVSMANNTEVKEIEINRAHRVIEFDAPIF